MKIRVECRATVEVDVNVSLETLRRLESGVIQLSDIVDESDAYLALRTDGEIEFVDWEPIPTKRAKP